MSRSRHSDIAELLAFRSRWVEAISFDPRLTGIQARIGTAAVHRYLNRNPEHPRFGMFWPSVARLADDLNAGQRTVQGALQQLRAFGYSELVEAGGGRHKPAVYRPILPSSAPIEAETPQPTAQNPATTGAKPRSQQHPTLREDPYVEVERERRTEGARCRSLRLSRDWQPGPSEIAFAEELGLDVTDTRNKFVDHFTPIDGQKGRSVDWSAKWRNWCQREIGCGGLNQSAYLGSNGSRTESVGDVGILQQQQPPVFWLDRLATLNATGRWDAEWGPSPGAAGCELPAKYRNRIAVRALERAWVRESKS
jgi:hypothetical protein